MPATLPHLDHAALTPAPVSVRGTDRKYQRARHDNSKAMWVGNLPVNVTEQAIRQHFSALDVVSIANLTRSRCAFINLKSQDAVAGAKTGKADRKGGDKVSETKVSSVISVRDRKKRRAISPPALDNSNDDEDKENDDDFVCPPPPSTSRHKGVTHRSSTSGTKAKKPKEVDNVQPTSTTTTTAKVNDVAPPTNKKPRTVSAKKGTTPKEDKDLSKDKRVQKCPTCIRNGESGPVDHSRSSSKRCPSYKPRRALNVSFNRGEGLADTADKGWYKMATVVMGQHRFLRAVQLAETIEKAVREMTQLLVEGNAILSRLVLHRLQAGIEIPSLWRSNIARQCFAAAQRSNGDPYVPKRTTPKWKRDEPNTACGDQMTFPGQMAGRRCLCSFLVVRLRPRPVGTKKDIPSSYKSTLITAATKQYVTNAEVYTICQLIPRLRKLVLVEIFERVWLPTSAKARKKIRAKVLSVVIHCLQGVSDYDPTSLRDFINAFVDDEHYTTFILDAISYVLDDMQQNVLNGRALFIAEKDPQTRLAHPTFVQAKDEFETWIPVHCAILQRYEEYARTPSARQYQPKLAPFTILPKYGFTPKFIIINTDRALFDLWTLAGWVGVEEHPEDFKAFQASSDVWWRRTFRVEKVETVSRFFRGAVYTDGVSCRISIKKWVSVAAGSGEGEGDEGCEDDGGEGEVLVADAFEDSDDEMGPTDAGTRDRTDRSTSKKQKGKASSVAAEPPTPGLDPYFRPVDIPDGTVVWAIDPGRREPIHAVSSTGQTYRVSLAHYYQLCGFTAARKKRERWMKQSPTVQEALNRVSHETYKTSELETFDRYLGELLPNMSLLLDFYFRRRHRRSDFDSYIRTQTALQEITRPFANCVVALGAALFSHNSRGHPTGPLKKLRQKLKDRAFALRLIGEFNTSRVCHLCEGFFDADNQRWWSLRVCRDVCGGRIMNRDYNAAKNILEIFLYMNIHAGQRPEPFFFGWDNLPPRPGVH
ncbi:hypothetical protein HK104_008750 [Borealophlyctis nickersoniae]|nr:hypothetical protein HK104_008750 [Borealophlyctis nickersoniae]